MRILIILASLSALAACSTEKYSKVPAPSGAWTPANASPDSTDNNILPEFARRMASQ